MGLSRQTGRLRIREAMAWQAYRANGRSQDLSTCGRTMPLVITTGGSNGPLIISAMVYALCSDTVAYTRERYRLRPSRSV